MGHSVSVTVWKKTNFLHKYKLCIVWNWFIAKNILILQKYLFWGYSMEWKHFNSSLKKKNSGHSCQ